MILLEYFKLFLYIIIILININNMITKLMLIKDNKYVVLQIIYFLKQLIIFIDQHKL